MNVRSTCGMPQITYFCPADRNSKIWMCARMMQDILPKIDFKPEAIQHVLLDLGGVLYGVDYTKTIDAFNALAGKYQAPTLTYSQAEQEAIFDQFEMGKTDEATFRNALRNRFNAHNTANKFSNTPTDNEQDTAWNAMLLGLMPQQEAALKKFRQRRPLAMLSNTNAIHWHKVRPEIEPIAHYFTEIFASCYMGMRKPNADIFLKALNTLGWDAANTVFVDDSIQHVIGARAVGLHAFHLQQTHELMLLAQYLE